MYYVCEFSTIFLVSPHIDTVVLEKRVLSGMEYIFFREVLYVTLAKISLSIYFRKPYQDQQCKVKLVLRN